MQNSSNQVILSSSSGRGFFGDFREARTLKGLDSSLYRALRLIFDPMARALLRSGIGVRPVIQALKDSFVEQAAIQHTVSKKPNKSEIARTIGLTRREVASIIERTKRIVTCPPLDIEAAANEVLGTWNTRKNLLDEQGSPKNLSEAELSHLIDDLGYRDLENDLLDLLLNRNVIERTEKRSFQAVNRAFKINQNLSQLMIHAIATAASTVPVNQIAPRSEDGHCQRVSSIRRPIENLVPKARADARRRIVRFVEEVDDYLMSTYSEIGSDSEPKEPDSVEPKKYIGVGAYYFEIEV